MARSDSVDQVRPCSIHWDWIQFLRECHSLRAFLFTPAVSPPHFYGQRQMESQGLARRSGRSLPQDREPSRLCRGRHSRAHHEDRRPLGELRLPLRRRSQSLIVRHVLPLLVGPTTDHLLRPAPAAPGSWVCEIAVFASSACTSAITCRCSLIFHCAVLAASRAAWASLPALVLRITLEMLTTSAPRATIAEAKAETATITSGSLMTRAARQTYAQVPGKNPVRMLVRPPPTAADLAVSVNG